MNITVEQPPKSCECKTWMEYQERNSVGDLCPIPVYKKQFTLRNEQRKLLFFRLLLLTLLNS